jgi:DNA-binding transcriptional MerR regulator
LKSTGGVELIPIGEAARRLGLRTSALRYYDQRGLVRPRTRQGGRRMYGPDELRRLAFITIALRLGIPLDTAAAILDAPGPRWRDAVREQLSTLERLIALTQGAQTFLTHALDCPAERPTRDCPTMTAALDLLVAGAPVDHLRERYAPRDATVTTP